MNDMSALELLKNSIFSLPQEKVDRKLLRISSKLQKLLPDPSLGSMERIERLARVVPASYQLSAFHRTSRSKLIEIENRLNSLVPDGSLNSEEKIDFLVQAIELLVPEKTDRICQKLQMIGDNRIRDNGSIPYANWSIKDLDLVETVKKKRDSGINPGELNYINEEEFCD